MRKISQGTPAHNARWAGPHPGAPLLLLAAALAFGAAAGCGSREPDRRTSPAPDPDQAAAAAPAACALQVEVGGWQAYRAVADAVARGEMPGLERLAVVADDPTVGLWCRSMAPYVPDRERLANWLQEAYAQELQVTGPRKRNADRRDMAVSYRYSLDRRDEVDALLREFTQGRWNCPLVEKVAFWVRSDSIPSPLRVAFLPGKPEIRFQEGVVLVDTGVLLAGGAEQLVGQIAALLYRRALPERDVRPLDLQGEASLTATFTLLRNEGIANWIEDRPHTHFDRSHPKLAKVAMVPEDFIKTANFAVALADSVLPALFADPQRMATHGLEFSRTLAASGSLLKLGYAMAAAIAGHFGQDQLREAGASPAAFLQAYQQAAALNPLPRPQVGAAGQPVYASLRPFDQDVAKRLLDLLQKPSRD